MQPLDGVRILSFEQYGAGPFGTQYLSDMGAEVIKVEAAGTEGDFSRDLGPYFINGEQTDSASSLFYQSFSRNKKSITLNLNSDKGIQILHQLVATADATADNLRGDVAEKLGITYDALKAVKPAIVCAHCSAYGRDGPRKSWPGFDYLMQAEAGYFQLCGEPGSVPTRFGLSIIDYMGGQNMALGLVSALLGAGKTGVGRDVDVNLFDTAVYGLSYVGNWALNSDYEPARVARSAHPTMVPCQLYTTADGWIYLMLNKARFWPKMCELIERIDLRDDARFKTLTSRLEHRDTLTELLDEALATRNTKDWLELFGGQIPAAPVLSPSEALESPYLQSRARVQQLNASDGSQFSVLAPAIDAGESRDGDTASPLLGEHTDEVLAAIGYSGEELQRLREEGVV